MRYAKSIEMPHEKRPTRNHAIAVLMSGNAAPKLRDVLARRGVDAAHGAF